MCTPDFLEDTGNELSYLRLHKPTENRGWVHILCAVFCSEIQFTDVKRLRLVEGLSSVSESKRTAVSKVVHFIYGYSDLNYEIGLRPLS